MQSPSPRENRFRINSMEDPLGKMEKEIVKIKRSRENLHSFQEKEIKSPSPREQDIQLFSQLASVKYF